MGSIKTIQLELGLKEVIPYIKEKQMIIKSLDALNNVLSKEPRTIMEKRVKIQCAEFIINKVVPDLSYIEPDLLEKENERDKEIDERFWKFIAKVIEEEVEKGKPFDAEAWVANIRSYKEQKTKKEC